MVERSFLVKYFHFDIVFKLCLLLCNYIIYHIQKYLLKETDRVLALKRQKRVASVTSRERGSNTTVICAMSASGIYILLMFIFCGKRISRTYGRHGSDGSIIRSTRNS